MLTIKGTATRENRRQKGKEMKKFNELPENVQQKIKNTLRAYDTVTVFFENGDYHFGICLKAHYADDHEYIGHYSADEIYTEEERILNYVNEFQCYPIEYKGKRDYAIFHTGKREVFKMVNGNIEIA